MVKQNSKWVKPLKFLGAVYDPHDETLSGIPVSTFMKDGKVTNKRLLDKIVGKTYTQVRSPDWTWDVKEGSCVSLFNNSMGLNYNYETHRIYLFGIILLALPIGWVTWLVLVWICMVGWSYLLLPKGFRVVSGGNYVWPNVESTIYNGWMIDRLNRTNQLSKKRQGRRLVGTLSETQFRRMIGLK
jgi:hypothetical protein